MSFDSEPQSSLSAAELIHHKREGKEFSQNQIEVMVKMICNGDMEEAQIGSLLMSMFLKGLNKYETALLTKAMKESGSCFNFPRGWIMGDKHSTGGVGDKVSLPLAPALASCGLKVPMMSGRGLGYTGGTLDKLESIPGYRVDFTPKEVTEALEKVGCCIVGQTKALNPADKKLYAMRDVTSTIDSLPLIVSSIVSKKACESLQGLVLDVKYGCGSFMGTFEEAEELANALVSTSEALGMRCSALISCMDYPLGNAVGHALEVEESILCLRGKGPGDLRELVVRLGGELLCNVGLVSDTTEGERRIRESLDNGSALEKFEEMLQFQGVSKAVAHTLCKSEYPSSCLPRSKMVTKLETNTSGTIERIDALSVAKFCLGLGGGRKKSSDRINFGVGVVLLKRVSDHVDKGEDWVKIHHDEPLTKDLENLLTSSLVINSSKTTKLAPLIVKRVALQ